VQWRVGIWGVANFELLCGLLTDADEFLEAGVQVCWFIAEAEDHAEECGESAEDRGLGVFQGVANDIEAFVPALLDEQGFGSMGSRSCGWGSRVGA